MNVESESNLPAIDLDISALLLDVDGTILDIAPVPGGVQMPPGLIDNIEILREKTAGALAFLSGRTIKNLDTLFSPLVLPAVGDHGAEVRLPNGTVQHDVPMPTKVKARFEELAALDPRIIFEDKTYSVALHYRLAPEFAGHLMDAARERVAEVPELNLTILNGHAVLEIKRAGMSKGTGLSELMALAPFEGRKPYFAGDDRTDEDALAVLPQFGGVGISVGAHLQGARFMVRRPDQMRQWLARLAGQEE